MPLYTYVISFKGSTYVSQSSHSNFRGFISWVDAIQNNITPIHRQELTQKAYRGEFHVVENQKHVWRKSIDISGYELVIHAVQTQP